MEIALGTLKSAKHRRAAFWKHAVASDATEHRNTEMTPVEENRIALLLTENRKLHSEIKTLVTDVAHLTAEITAQKAALEKEKAASQRAIAYWTQL